MEEQMLVGVQTGEALFQWLLQGSVSRGHLLRMRVKKECQGGEQGGRHEKQAASGMEE